MSTQTISHYRILRKLGAGGMGEVYLAEDTKLERTVALKILPAGDNRDQQRLRRFIQEAKVASKLSHPNVCVIHEVGETEDGRPFIAMEYVEGKSLDAHIGGRPLETREIVRIGLQVADALDEAHAKNIIHRDIKSANIMLTTRGKVKVLDFGLAKLNAPIPQSAASNVPTQAKTDPGLLMGTVQYMSPEQALGKEVDQRTDIFSLGVVLYEMATAQLPFAGASATETIDKITHAQPEALARFNYNVPPELERIVRKALRKDRDDRYQTARDLLVDLRSLKKELDFEAQLQSSEQSQSLSSGTVSSGAMSSTSAPSISRHQSAQGTGEIKSAPATVASSSAEYLVGEIKRHRRGFIIAALATILIAGVAFGIYKFAARDKSPVAFEKANVTRLTTTGKVIDAAISPDGKYVVYVVNDGGQQSLWVRQVNTSSMVQIVPPADVSYQGLTFSHDGDYVYYNLWDKKSVGVIYRVPALGGPSRKVIVDVMPGVAVSPDNKRLAFTRGFAATSEQALMTANVDGTDEKKLLMSGRRWFAQAAWSPDGKTIAIPAGIEISQGVSYMQILEIPAEGGPEKILSQQKWVGVAGLAWLRGGDGLVIAGADQAQTPFQLWQVSYPSGEAHKLTNDLNGYGVVSLTEDSSALVTTQSDAVSNVWIAPAADLKQYKKITSGRYEGFGLAWTPDGRVVYVSGASGNPDLWMMMPDGTNQKQLTTDAGADVAPTISADGRQIVFISNRTGVPHLWRMDADGGNQRQLTDGGGEWAPFCSPADNWVYYISADSGQQALTATGKQKLWKINLDGSAPVLVADKLIYNPAISPDGKWIAYSYWDEQSNPQRWGREVVSLMDGKTVKTFDVPSTAVGSTGQILLRWTPDSRALSFIDNRGGVSNIWSQSLDGTGPKQLTSFTDNQIFYFDWSRDGKQLAVARGIETSDVFLIKNK